MWEDEKEDLARIASSQLILLSVFPAGGMITAAQEEVRGEVDDGEIF
jgi:hypothetical protein